jgi:glycosyltransferase involved in cell wall biosynthesis
MEWTTLNMTPAYSNGSVPAIPLTERPVLSLILPIYNEEAVIVSSVQQVLQSSWTNMEILVIDDGSKDNTAAEVEAHFSNHPMVRLLRFENGGKAMALNRGLAAARGDIVVALDADTLFARATIGRLARWFRDPRVGAVAGNAPLAATSLDASSPGSVAPSKTTAEAAGVSARGERS